MRLMHDVVNFLLTKYTFLKQRFKTLKSFNTKFICTPQAFTYKCSKHRSTNEVSANWLPCFGCASAFASKKASAKLSWSTLGLRRQAGGRPLHISMLAPWPHSRPPARATDTILTSFRRACARADRFKGSFLLAIDVRKVVRYRILRSITELTFEIYVLDYIIVPWY